eukprot:CAMPEP_0115859686 /NCGR_PEP_ID=MMETSP0287-20121206/16744_1 /TAXON_ID=412157 /ORGANISM="Chrysochromulina rotalis, Strain UIO044" /LENGTH=291 /DNA_ID=CAMNT_0003313995 /DNA_START=64 /DNA_END=939 /DNA_ORIENTATION=-
MRFGEDLRVGSRLLIGATQVLCSSPLRRAVALRDLSPIVPGHAVVMPICGATLSSSLDDAGWLDLWHTALLAQSVAELGVGASASNLLLREGVQAKWKDAPVHIHVVPRLPDDFAKSDDVFAAMEAWVPHEAEAGCGAPPWVLPEDADRHDRTSSEMAEEASVYRSHLKANVEAVPRAFGRFTIPHEHVFFDSTSGLTQAFVNLRPLAPGHVLVTPRRVAARLCELSVEEHDDLFRSVRHVQHTIVAERNAASGGSAVAGEATVIVELGVQDGVIAGQSVPHVHVHVIPRE